MDYYEVAINGKRNKKGTINLSSGTKVVKRTGLKPNEHKFIIKTKHREWYLWCKGNKGDTEVNEWCRLINNMINSAKNKVSNIENKENDDNNQLHKKSIHENDENNGLNENKKQQQQEPDDMNPITSFDSDDDIIRNEHDTAMPTPNEIVKYITCTLCKDNI